MVLTDKQSQVHVRSRVTITDEKTKGGTFVDGVELRDGSRELKGLEHTIRPGKYPYDLRIKWHQVCLSFSFSSKELKANPLAAKRERLEHLDIKTIIEYVVGETTHVVTNKRNTAKGLQALINGKHIVNNSYIDALVYAATSEDLAEPENLSPLERDFDGAWPDPTEHLPPPGKEVIDMPKADLEAAFLPKSERRTMFEEFTFVFCSKEQFENLLPVVTNGHGKALQYPLEIGRTTADELEQYMHNAAGRKGLGGTATQSVRGGVILVRPVLKGDMQKWADDLADAVSVRVNQRPIDQGDFLKIILNQDRYLLRRPCETSGDLEDVAGPSSQFETAKATLKTLQNSSPLKPLTRALTPPDESEQPPPKRQRRDRIIKSRFDAFDDGLDVDIAAIPAHAPTHQYTPGGVSQSHVRDFDSSQRIAASQLQAKIAESPSDHDNDMEDLLPAAAAMKRHRLEMEQKGKRQAKAATTDVLEVVKKPKKEREIDILEAARKRREAEEEAIRQDREALAHAGVDVENVRNLAVIVEMELPVRNNRSSRADGVQSDRWDARWNGLDTARSGRLLEATPLRIN
ncbi:putative dna damage response protein [Phaeomoniella chlamydospora]|uniref:Putative dna damage response protein n=1 Tax=Phaeomoniella chlamydospora TaxID=158046 RepID=A0A0G2G258_PHACM|nr:putative dna damage response protein [Phaeomoniella chlamydospora]